MNKDYLKRIFSYAYNTVPYYNNKMNEIGIDITKLNFPRDFYRMKPFTKETIKNIGWVNFINQDYLDNEFNIKKNQDIRIEKTSGTTGEPMSVPWLNTDYYSSMMNHWRYRQTNFNINPSSSKCDNIRNRFSNFPFFIDLVNKKMNINNFMLTYENILCILDNLYLFQPEWLYIQPSILFILVKVAKENNKSFPDSIRYIEYIGEPVLEYYRNYIEEYIHVPSTNMYGCAETNGIANECKHGNLHLLSNNVITEILDNEDKPVINKIGNVCVTSYYNSVMPIIRYKLNDKGIIQYDKKCNCGNLNPIINLYVSRLPEYLVLDDKEYYPNGSIYYPINKLKINKVEKSDILFKLTLIDLEKYEITVYTKDVYEYDKEMIICNFKNILTQFGITNIDFNFIFIEFEKKNENIGLLRLY